MDEDRTKLMKIEKDRTILKKVEQLYFPQIIAEYRNLRLSAKSAGTWLNYTAFSSIVFIFTNFTTL